MKNRKISFNVVKPVLKDPEVFYYNHSVQLDGHGTLEQQKVFEKIETTTLVKSTLPFGIKINKLISKRSLVMLKNTTINRICTQLKLDKKAIRSDV